LVVFYTINTNGKADLLIFFDFQCKKRPFFSNCEVI
jgi:hypothetical protein